MNRLVVVVPTAGGSDLLGRTLSSLAQCDLPNEYEKIIVVENGPPSGAQSAVESAPPQLRAEYVHIKRANKSHALNCVFADLADDDLVYLIDDDVRFSKNCLVDFVAAARDKKSGSVFGGPLRIDSEGDPPEKWKSFLPGSMVGWEPTVEEFNARDAFFLGANWAVFAGDVTSAGGFDPRFGPGSPLGATGQEWTMQIALRKRGAHFQYVPSAIVWHHVDFSRFSKDFLIRRKYRGGLEAGIRYADFMYHTPRWHDYLRHPLMRARLRYLRNNIAVRWWHMCGRAMDAFRRELDVEHAKGFLFAYPRAMSDLRETDSP